MADTATRPSAVALPWSVRLFEAARLPPIWLGAVLALVLLATYLAVLIATGRLSRAVAGPEASSFRGILVLLVLLAYVPTAHVYLARWTRRNADALLPLLAAPVSTIANPAQELRSPAGRAIGAAGALLYAVLFLLLPSDADVDGRPDTGTFAPALAWVAVPVLGWMMARFAYALVHNAVRVSGLAEGLRRIELIDPTPLAPFVQQGLGGALLVMVMLAIGLGGAVGQAPVLASSFATVSALFAVGVAALVLPVLGVRRRIRAEKCAELQALRARIHADRDAILAAAPDADRAAARLPALLALEARLDAVREWPFNVSSLIRFALYLTLGLGSWLGAAGVERLLDLALD